MLSAAPAQPEAPAVREPREEFVTHCSYLRGFSTIISLASVGHSRAPNVDVLRGLSAVVQASQSYASVTRAAITDVNYVGLRRALRNAWGTELLLASAASHDDDLVGVANNWSVVQAYYACYHAVQALTLARKQPSPKTHDAVRNQYAEMWVTRGTDGFAPWSLGWQLDQCNNVPADAALPKLYSNLQGSDEDNCWSFAAMALKTTRVEPLKKREKNLRRAKKADARKVWQATQVVRAKEGKRPTKAPTALPYLSADEKTRIDAEFAATSIIDYLLRLRVRSQYKDPTMFTDGPINPWESREVHEHLVRITASTLLLHEMHIARTISKAQLGTLVQEWLGEGSRAGLGVHQRRDLLLD